MLMHVRVHNDDTKFGFWLPLFLLIPLALVVLIILSPLILIAILVLKPIHDGHHDLSRRSPIGVVDNECGVFCVQR